MSKDLTSTQRAALKAVLDAETLFKDVADVAFISSRVVCAYPTLINSIKALVRANLIHKRLGREDYVITDAGKKILKGGAK